MVWLTAPSHHRWLERESVRLLDFARQSRHPDGGFGMVRADGTLDESADVALWVTCRMTHVFALASLMGQPGAGPLVDHGIQALTGRLRDHEHGGWFAAVGGNGPTATDKEAYGHAFVILAASSALAAGRAGAGDLLDEALAVHTERFWDDGAGMSRESFDRQWAEVEDYRGINANMHTVEAYLAAADVTGDAALLRRAARIVERAVHDFARHHSWRLPEHFDSQWQPLLDFHRDQPSHPFRPYGATIGHWLEWSRLTLQTAQALRHAGLESPAWMHQDAASLYAAAVQEGWNADGVPGFVYTVDWDGRPVVRERMHWVVAEAIGAAAALWRVTGDTVYAADYERWWDFAATYHLDLRQGSWWHELTSDLSVGGTVWPGKIDVYHAFQATLLPLLPVAPALAPSLAAGNLDVPPAP